MLHSIVTSTLLVSLLSSAPSPLPGEVQRGASILDRHVAATGGPEAYIRSPFRVSTGTVLYESANSISVLTIHESRTTDRRWHSQSETLGDQFECSTGENAWLHSDMTGSWLRSDAGLARALREAPIDAPAMWREHFERVEFVGSRQSEGQTYDAVTLFPKNGQPETRTFDPESGLLFQTECEIELEGNSIPTVFTYSDYREVDGLLLPHSIRQEHTGMPGLTIQLERIVHEEKLPASLFEPPARIRALLGQ